MSDVFLSSMELMVEKQAAGHKLLKEEITGMRSSLKQAMDKGLAPADMEAARALSEAVDAADTVVDTLYVKLCG